MSHFLQFFQSMKNKSLKIFTGCFLLLTSIQFAYSQQSLLVESYLRNSYITRGFIGTKDPTIEGSITYSFTPDYRVNLWGLSSMLNKYSEIDLTVEYQHKNLTLSLIDYYNPSANKTFNYFNLSDYNTAHTLDLILFYRISETLPLGLKWSSYLYGCDLDPLTNNRMFSTYMEISYMRSLNRMALTPCLGFVPWKSWYANQFSIVNCGVKLERDLMCNKSACIPATFNMIYNPKMTQLNLSFILGIQLRNKVI